MTALDDYLESARLLTREEFELRFSGQYFFGELVDDGPEGEPDFVTGVISIEELRARHEQQVAERRARLRKGLFVFRIQKRSSNDWLTWISVGRAHNNDIVLRHPSVSKLHAKIDGRAPISAEANGGAGLWLADTGSRMGTAVNDRRLRKSEPCELFPKDHVRFGDIDAVLVDAGELYDELKKRL